MKRLIIGLVLATTAASAVPAIAGPGDPPCNLIRVNCPNK